MWRAAALSSFGYLSSWKYLLSFPVHVVGNDILTLAGLGAGRPSMSMCESLSSMPRVARPSMLRVRSSFLMLLEWPT
jgi:hypothetical protein